MSTGSRLDGMRGSIVLAIAALVLLFPTLARSAQNGDGIEFVRVAVAGGVPHPTGFPLQAWLDRIVVLVPLLTPAFRIALLDLAAHAATVFVASELLRRLGVGFTGRAAGAAAFTAFPPVWELAVVPEVFSIANLLVACLLLHLAVVAELQPGAVRPLHAIGLGALVGLAATQHPITLEAAPVFVAAAYLVLREPIGRWLRFSVMAGVFASIVVGLFASLPLLRGAAVWPNWGTLSGPTRIVDHALRVDYGSFSMAGDEPGKTILGIDIFLRDLVRYSGVTILAALVGLAPLARRRAGRAVAIGIAGMVLAGLTVLVRAKMPAELLAVGYLSKLDGPTVLGLAVLAGAGVDALRRQATRPGARRLLDATVAALILVSLVRGWPVADASRDDTLDLVAIGLGAELPQDAVYLAENDVESFQGAPTSHGVRYPLAIGLLPQPWYVDTVAPRIEPRVKLSDDPPPSSETIVRQALASGLSVASTNEALLEMPDRKPKLEGLLYVVDGSNETVYSAETVHAAVSLCPVVDDLPALPPEGHVFSRHFFHRFSRAYAGAASYLEAEGQRAGAASAREVERALDGGADRAAWIAACDRLTEATKSGVY